MKLWQKFVLLVIGLAGLGAYIAQDNFFHPRESRSFDHRIETPVNPTTEELSSAMKQAEESGKDVVIHFEPPPSPEEVAALQPCREMLDSLTVGPPINDERRCRINDREATLLTVALEDSNEWEFVGPGEPMRKKGNAP